MKVLTLCFWRRPKYAKRCLEALRQCTGIGEYLLIISLDGPPHSEMVHICSKVDFASVDLQVSTRRLTCNGNTRHALRQGFARGDYVIHVEEDILLAPDALLYFEWAKQFGEDKTLFSIAAWRDNRGWLPDQGPFPSGQKIQTKAVRAPYFHIWGWATWADQWEDMDAHWTTGTDQSLSWDTCLTKYRAATGRWEIAPLISRATNIGAELGTHRGDSLLPYWAGSDGFQRDTNYQLLP